MSLTKLDYPGGKITMEVLSEVEANWRVNAVRKEPWTTQFIENMSPGAIFWDIGANVGSYALIAAYRGHQVIAVEPAYQNYYALCHNFALNDLLHRLLAFNVVMGKQNGFIWLHYADMRRGAANHFMDGPLKQTHHRQQLPVWTLDTMAMSININTVPHFLKIDVDGAEMEVLEGGAGFLSSELVQGVIFEARKEWEEDAVKVMHGYGLKAVARWDEREGTKLDIAYIAFDRQ